MLTASTRLGPYEIVAPLGAGGMGEVYRARDTRLGREVAVKVLPELFAHDADRQARFEREARAVAALSHPNILAIHDYGTHEAVTYAVMELLEGETLRDGLAKGPLSWREAVEIGGAIADGLAAAHARGIVHRDLKPENLFLTADGRLKILDFGLARITALPSSQSETGPYVPVATDAGAVMGTVGYMSPEQVRGQPADARSDIFSFGCVLYEMVTGRRAFQRETAAETMTAILHNEPANLTDSGQQVPAELRRIIQHCLAKNPNARLQSARDLALGLRATATDPGLHHAPGSRHPTRLIVGLLAAAALIGLGALSVHLLNRGGGNGQKAGKPTEEAKAIESLAVLPFANEAADLDAGFLGDGMTISLINSLSQVRDLKVRPFGSVTRYKRGDSDPLTAGRELQVEAVLTGRIHKVNEDLIVIVELADVAEKRTLWIEQYQRKYANLLAVQQELARDATAKLRLRLSGEEAGQLARRPTQNLEAFRLYILGRVEWDKRTEEGLKKGITYFEQAIQEDPNYALAYAGLADCYLLLGVLHVLAPKEASGKARAAAEKALEKDANLAEAHTSLAYLQWQSEWDWAGAERQYKQAIQLRPTYPTAHHWYAMHLVGLGRNDEALAEIRQAQKLDPSSLVINSAIGRLFLLAGRLDDAIGQCRKTLAMDPNFPPALYELGMAYAQKGMYPEAITEFQKARQQSTRILGYLGYAYAKSGQESQARKYLAELRKLAKDSYVSPYSIALIYVGLGDKVQAFTCLHQAVAERDPWLLWVKFEPMLDELRSDSRFGDLLQRMGLADKTAARDQDIHSVAVLPFQNVGGDPKTEYLSDGVADQIINSLSQVRRQDLKVRPFTSVSRYKGKEPDIPTFGRELNVQMIVTGKLHQQGNHLSISVALVDVGEDNQLWGQHYQGKLGEILDLQDRIARDVAANLRLRLSGEEEKRLTKRYTENPEAYLLYREAAYHFNKFTEEGLTTAIEYCQRALRKDSHYALAYAGLGRCYILLGAMHRGPRETFPEAKKVAAQALAIDAALPDAHAVLGAVHLFYDWNWTAAERELKQSIALDSGFPSHNLYGFCLAVQGRPEEALAVIRQGAELDPLSAAKRYEVAKVYNWLRQYGQAVAAAQQALALDPNFSPAYGELGLAQAQQGNHEEALATLHKGLNLGTGHPRLRGLLGYAYAVAEKREEARKIREELKKLPDRRFGCAFAIARIHAALGEKDQAFEWLRKSCDEHDPLVIWLKVDPTLENLRKDPRFKQMLKEMRLPP